jgi:hypothetical protein
MSTLGLRTGVLGIPRSWLEGIMGGRSFSTRLLLSATFCLALCESSQAAFLQLEPSSSENESPAGSDSCEATTQVEGEATVSEDGQQARVFVSASARAAGSDCDGQSPFAGGGASLKGFLLSDTGESGPVTLCVSASASQDASSSPAPYHAVSALALASIFDGLEIVYEYPNTIISPEGASSDVERFEIEPMIGESIFMLLTGSATAIGGAREGSAAARTRGEMVLSIGPCSAAMAPASSPKTLMVLIVALALVGAAAAGKRRLVGY